MSLEHKQHRAPSVRCPDVGEKGSRITYASSRSLWLEKQQQRKQNTRPLICMLLNNNLVPTVICLVLQKLPTHAHVNEVVRSVPVLLSSYVIVQSSFKVLQRKQQSKKNSTNNYLTAFK